MAEDYLQHYGVLGMKWGQHRAQKKGTTYKYKSLRTKAYESNSNRLSKNAYASKDAVKEAKRLASRSNKFDKKMSQYSANTSTKTVAAARIGASVLTGLGLVGMVAAAGYNSMAGYGVGGYAARKAVKAIGPIAMASGAAAGFVDSSVSSKTYQQARVLGDGRVKAALQASTGYIGRSVNEQRVHNRIRSNKDI